MCFKDSDKVSNNIAEYEGLLAGLRAAIALGIKHILIKGRALADFMAEWTDTREEEPQDEEAAPSGKTGPSFWTMHFDGALSMIGNQIINLSLTMLPSPFVQVPTLGQRVRFVSKL